MQTKAGVIKAKQTIEAKYGVDYWQRIGAKGGKISKTGGFGNGEEGRLLAREAGRLGGTISRRTKRYG